MAGIEKYIPMLDDAALVVGKSMGIGKPAGPALIGQADDGAALVPAFKPNNQMLKSTHADTMPPRKAPQAMPAAPAENGFAKLADTADDVGNKLVQGTFAMEMGGMALGAAAGWMNLNKVKSVVTAPATFLSRKVIKSAPEGMGTLSSTIMDGSFVLSNAVGAYHVVLGYKEKCSALREMCAQMMGRKVEDVPLNWVMNSNDVPKLVQEARSHIKKEHGWRGLMQLGGVGINLRSLIRGGTGGWWGLINGMAPMLGSAAVDMVMGQSLVEVYTPMNAAFKAKQDIPPNAYANFLLAASHELKTHGAMGQKVAQLMAMKCTEQKIDPATLLRKIESGEFAKVEIPALIKEVEASRASHPLTTVAKGGHAKRHGERHVVGDGKFTGKLQQEKAQQHISPGVA